MRIKIKYPAMNYNNILTLLLILYLTVAATVQAQPVTETRSLEKSFPVNGEMSLEITNKYGKIHLAPSPDDSVHINVDLRASAKNASRLRNLTEGISFNISSTSYFILAETNFSKGPADLLESIRNITNNIISAESKIEIDYYAAVPPGIKIKIDNRYGDIYLESLPNKINVHHSNGSLKAEELSGDNYFDLNFSDATIKSLIKSRIELSYSDLRIDYADNLTLNSTSSKIFAGSIVYLDTESRRDKYSIDKISNLDVNSYFSSFNIDRLYNSLRGVTKYGNVDLRETDTGFSLLSLESSYTDIKIITPDNTSFSLDVKLINCPSVIPVDWVLEETALSEERNEYLYSGEIGKKQGDARIILDLTKGSFSIY